MSVPAVVARPVALAVRRPGLLTATGGGAVAALACPPIDVAPAMLAGLVLLALAVHDARDTRSAAGRAFAWAFAGQLVVLRFVVPVVDRFTGAGAVGGLAVLVVLAALQSLGWAAGGAVAHALWRRRRVPFAPAFAGGVLVASTAPALFAWTPASFLVVHPALVQLADVVGERGVSALLALAAAGTALGIARRSWRPVLAALALLAALEGYGLARLASLPDGGPRLRVALLSQDAPPRRGVDRDPGGVMTRRLQAQSVRADRAGAHLVVWPEASFPIPLGAGVTALRGGSASPVAAGARAARLVGVETVAGTQRFNSARLVLPDGTLAGRYDKVHLLPFGETVPLPFTRALFARSSGTAAGRDVRPLLLPRPGAPPVRLGVLICYEDIDAGLGRRLARTRPQLLVDITNDAWFGGTAAPALQERVATMRAVELRTALVRAVNRGPSTWVDAAGRVRARRDGATPGTLTAAPQLRSPGATETLYARLGDWPLIAVLALLTLAPGRRRTTSPPPSRRRARARRARPAR